jgi:hypothetical protein
MAAAFRGHGPTLVGESHLSQPGRDPATFLFPADSSEPLKKVFQFDLKGLAGFRIEFKMYAGGKVTQAVFYQPDTATVLNRKR